MFVRRVWQTFTHFPDSKMTALPRVRAGLLKHPLDKQVLVYDTQLDRVHLLDPTTACVLELLEEGGWTPDGISDQIVARLDVSPNQGFLPLAIDELRNAGLLDQSRELTEPLVDVKRRELLRNIALTGAAALLVPTVASLTATRGYAQATASLRGNCNTCTTGPQCASGNCCAGLCMANASCTGQATNDCCNAGSQCVSGNCVGGFCAAALAATCAPCSSGAQCAGGACNNVGACCTSCNNKLPTGSACSGGGNCCSDVCAAGVCT